MSRLTIEGMLAWDPDFFAGMSIPSGMDLDTLVGEIRLKGFDLELVYPSYVYMKSMTERWSAAHLWGWQKAYDAIQLEYEPLWNVDAEVLETRNLSGSDALTHGHVLTRTGSVAVADTGTDVNLNSTNAFNGGTWADREKESFTHGQTETTNYSSLADTDSGVDSRATTDTGTVKTVRKGNIGVTTSQDMLRQELDIAKFSIYERIADEFVNAFCILVF